METTKKQTEKVEQGEKITRKQAIKKAGVTALAASSLLLLNSPASAQDSSTNIKSNNGHGNNLDGYDVSNPGKKDKVDVSDPVDDEN